MIVGREHLIYFENLAKKHSQIYPDSCDYGLSTSEVNMEEVKTRIANLKEMFECHREEWEHGCSVRFFIPYEMEGGNYHGVNLKITYNNDKLSKISFITIDIGKASQKQSGFKSE